MNIRFDGDKKTYSLAWTELLGENGMPFSSLDELADGVKLQAPYTDGASSAVSFWPAVVDKGLPDLTAICWQFSIYFFPQKLLQRKAKPKKRRVPTNTDEPAVKKSKKVGIKTGIRVAPSMVKEVMRMTPFTILGATRMPVLGLIIYFGC